MDAREKIPPVVLCSATVTLAGLAAALFRLTRAGFVSVLTQKPTPEAGWLTTPTSSYQPVAQVESQALLTISTIVLLVLLAAALVAGSAFWVLVLTRYTSRKAELATRSALGATPRQIMTELSAPIVRVTVLGATIGMVMSGALTLIVFALWPGVVQRTYGIALLAGLAGGFLTATLLTTVSIGALWLFVVRGSLSDALRAGERATTS